MTEFDDFNVPVCRFGPGGDYVKDWPAKKSQLPEPESNPLGKVLALIVDVMGTTVSGELMIQSQGPTDEPDHTNYTASTAGAEDSSRISAEPMLFADDSRSSRGVRHKPHYRIRAYRRSSRKRTARKIDTQATLFEVDTQSQSAA